MIETLLFGGSHEAFVFAMGDFGAESIAVCTLESMLARAPQVRVVVPSQKILGSHAIGGSSPDWSPDGRRIACHLVTSRGPALHSTDILIGNVITDIWTVAADGSDPRQLTSDGRSTGPAWGP